MLNQRVSVTALLVLGAALRTVIALTREGDEMKMAQMFGDGPTVKRGIAKKQ
jgi:hypothetical protein